METFWMETRKRVRILKRITAVIISAAMLCQGIGMTAFAAAGSGVGAGVSLGAGPDTAGELRAVWISYLDWEKLPSEQEAFQAEVDKMMDRCVELGMNAVFVHVRPDGDAMYPSAHFPWSKFVTGTQGVNPGYDPLRIFIDSAHRHGLQFHAWINPFRVTGYLNRWEHVSADSPAKRWLSDGDASNDRWVLKQGGEYYAAVPEGRVLIIAGVRVVVAGYFVVGIHFVVYFYPTVKDGDPNQWFDQPEYDASGSGLSIVQWRRENVNQLIRGVYRAVKEIKPTVQFGVSPEGYVAHLRSETRLFVDIDTWMSQDGYLDYIMPQIYWGFEHKMSDGSAAPFAFGNNLQTWLDLKDRGNVRLYLGLAMYKTGSNTKDNNAVPEWLRYDDIMKRQVEAGRATGKVSGYCFYAYSSFQEATCQAEAANLMTVFR